MKKLKLQVDELRVETFQALEDMEEVRGTIRARSTDNVRWCSETYCQECTNWSCADGHTCDGAFC